MGDKLRAAVIGLGARGMFLLKTAQTIPDLDVTAVCDVRPDRVAEGLNALRDMGCEAQGYDDYRRVIERGGVDLAIIATDWTLHWRVCVDFMEAGIYAGCEVSGAASLDECWALVRAYERTGTPMMMLENCCYGRNELAVLNMARQGVFGRVVYAECGYCHDLRSMIGDVNNRLCPNVLLRNGDLYPTHGAGPMAKLLNVNHGNRFVSIASMATPAWGMQDYLRRNDPDSPLADARFACGDVVASLVKCAGGEVLMMRHNMTLPRPYSRANLVQGTRAIYSEDKNAVHIDGAHEHNHWEDIANLLPEYDHPLWRDEAVARRADGHGGMDYLVLAAFADAVRRHAEPPIDVYDSATLMAITPLSEQSVAAGGAPQMFPDFTRGRWMEPRRVCGGKYCLDREGIL